MIRILVQFFIFCVCNVTYASTSYVRIEAGAVGTTRNEFKIPTSTGTDVALSDETNFAYRFEGMWNLFENGSLRFVIAPFSVKSSFQSTANINFDNQTFSAGSPIDVKYKFNSFRVGYVHHFVQSEKFSWDLGLTAKLRDAEIRLTQGALTEGYTNTGFVPLLYLGFDWILTDFWFLRAQIDGAGSSQGYAIDGMIQVSRSISDQWEAGLVFRGLDGGADNEKVKNFTTNIYGLFSLDYKF